MDSVQFIKDSEGKDILAVIPISMYNNMMYSDANLEASSIPEWHKKILDKELVLLEKNIANNECKISWNEFKKEIEAKYGY